MKFFLRLCILTLTTSTLADQKQQTTTRLLKCPSALQAATRTNKCCTLTQWADKIFALKERPIELSTLPALSDYQKAILTQEEFLTTIARCAQVIGRTLTHPDYWLNNRSIIQQAPQLTNILRTVDLKNIQSNFMFKPYAQRLIVAPGSKVALFGDLHGSAHSLMRDLIKLYSLGFIDNNFKLTKPNFYMLFLGDYIDRGIYGAECFYTLARLKLANPTHVFLLRGNHEDYNVSVSFRNGELGKPEKDAAPSFLLELQHKFNLSKEQEIMLSRFYDLLPIVLYLGCGTDKVNFIQCCHGGMELGYTPHALLNAPKNCSYESISIFARRTNFNLLLPKQAQDSIKLPSSLDILCSELQDLVFPAPYFKNPLTGSERCIGFLWSDFYTNPQKQFSPYGDKRFSRWVFGRQLTHDILAWGNSSRSSLKGVMRAHQHNNTTGGPMLDMLCCNKGLVNVWGDNTLFTLVSSPDSKLDNSGEQCFTYDSFALLIPQTSFSKWQLDHYFQDTGYQRTSWKHKLTTFNQAQALGSSSGYTRATTQALISAAKKHQTEVR